MFTFAYKTGMLPAASPTKVCKPYGLVIEADDLQKVLHNKRDGRSRLDLP